MPQTGLALSPNFAKKHLMADQEAHSDVAPAREGTFATTHWSVVLAATDGDSGVAEKALERLCRTYWPPLYAFLRRDGHNEADAQDLVQGFFTSLFAHQSFSGLDPGRGKFRSFLLGALKHFLANEHDRTHALKRGGALTFVPWEESIPENTFRSAGTDALSPDLAFEKSWALTLLNQVLVQLRDEYGRAGNAATFEALQIYLTGDKGDVPYAETATRLNLGESALKMSIQRLRRRYGDLLRKEIAQTVDTQQEIDEEIRALFAAVRR
jgi:RNA polymerase sigma-70 factor (ECF subfamily)